MDPIYVQCHTCHADAGQACRFHRDEKYHIFRERRASFLSKQPAETWPIDTVHALQHGAACDDRYYEGKICCICGQTIQRLKDIEETLKIPFVPHIFFTKPKQKKKSS